MFKTKKIYMDDRCYCRPLDEGGTDEEKMAIILIMRNINKVDYKIMGSTWVEDKIGKSWMGKTNGKKRRAVVQKWYNTCVGKFENGNVLTLTKKKVANLTTEYFLEGLSEHDTYHLAFAEGGECDYLLTTDRYFIEKSSKLDICVNVIDPVNLFKEVKKWPKRN